MTPKIEPYKHSQLLESWEKKKELKGLTKANAQVTLEFLDDMKTGMHTANKKPLGANRLNNLRQKLSWTLNQLQTRYKLNDITTISQKQVTTFFNDEMRKGKIRTRRGQAYESTPSYVNIFKAFWHWYMRREGEKERLVKDITAYLDTSPMKENSFVYFIMDDLKKLSNEAKYNYRVLMWFLFDSGIRAPTELMNVRACDLTMLENGKYELHIRENTSKTFGRKIKLMLCSDILKEYLERKKIKGEEYIFKIEPRVTNQYLKRLFKKVLGDYETKGGEKTSDVNMYDFRHSSACYWLPRYKSESALKYRFGWKKSEMVHYYSKLLGMQDTIQEDDLMLGSEYKNKMEKELEMQKQQNVILEEKAEAMQAQLLRMDKILTALTTERRIDARGARK